MKRKFITIDNRQISYLENDGQGPSIIFVHGNSQAAETFQKQFSGELNKKFHLIAIDLLGHGDSERAEKYSLAIFAELLEKFSRGLGIDDAIYVGHSLGGHIVLEGLEKLSARGAMIFGTPPLANPPAMEIAFLENPNMGYLFTDQLEASQIDDLVNSFLEKKESVDLIKSVITKTDPAVRPNIGASVGALDYRDEIEVIRTIETPIAVIHGEKDSFINGDYIAALPFETLWKNRVFEQKNVGHFPQLEGAEEFNDILLSFANDLYSETQLSQNVSNIEEEITFPI